MDVFEVLKAQLQKVAERFDLSERSSLLRSRSNMKRTAIISFILLFSSGCVVVGGYSSERGWFLWPGSIVLLVVVALLFLLLRRRR